MSDEPDLIDRTAQMWRNRIGEDVGPAELLQEFQLCGPGKRVEALDQLDEELRTADTSNLRKYVRLTKLRRDMDHMHHSLRQIRR